MRKFILLTMVIYLCAGIMSSCGKKDKAVSKIITSVTSGNDPLPQEELDSFKMDMIQKGDTNNYIRFRHALYCNHESSLPYALIMANKYNYGFAYYDVYSSIINIYENNDIKLDNDAKTFALKYLMKAVELHDANALYELSDLYDNGKFFPKDSVKADDLLEKARKFSHY